MSLWCFARLNWQCQSVKGNRHASTRRQTLVKAAQSDTVAGTSVVAKDSPVVYSIAGKRLRQVLENASWDESDEVRAEVERLSPAEKLTAATNLGCVVILGSFAVSWISGEDPLGGVTLTYSSLYAAGTGLVVSIPLILASILARTDAAKSMVPELQDLHEVQGAFLRPFLKDLTFVQQCIMTGAFIFPGLLFFLPTLHGMTSSLINFATPDEATPVVQHVAVLPSTVDNGRGQIPGFFNVPAPKIIYPQEDGEPYTEVEPRKGGDEYWRNGNYWEKDSYWIKETWTGEKGTVSELLPTSSMSDEKSFASVQRVNPYPVDLEEEYWGEGLKAAEAREREELERQAAVMTLTASAAAGQQETSTQLVAGTAAVSASQEQQPQQPENSIPVVDPSVLLTPEFAKNHAFMMFSVQDVNSAAGDTAEPGSSNTPTVLLPESLPTTVESASLKSGTASVDNSSSMSMPLVGPGLLPADSPVNNVMFDFSRFHVAPPPDDDEDTQQAVSTSSSPTATTATGSSVRGADGGNAGPGQTAKMVISRSDGTAVQSAESQGLTEEPDISLSAYTPGLLPDVTPNLLVALQSAASFELDSETSFILRSVARQIPYVLLAGLSGTTAGLLASNLMLPTDGQVKAIKDAIENSDRFFKLELSGKDNSNVSSSSTASEDDVKLPQESTQQLSASFLRMSGRLDKPNNNAQAGSSNSGSSMDTSALVTASDLAAENGVLGNSDSWRAVSAVFNRMAVLWLVSRRNVSRLAFNLTAFNVVMLALLWQQTSDLSAPLAAGMAVAITEVVLTNQELAKNKKLQNDMPLL